MKLKKQLLERKKTTMHELGILYHAFKTVTEIAEKHGVEKIKFLTLEVGKQSDVVPAFLKKLFPVAVEKFPLLIHSELKIVFGEGSGLIIKEIGY